MNKSTKSQVTSNLFWRLLERFGAQGVTFIVSLELAKVLDPEVYGTVALITVITSILQVFVDSGMGSALIQKKDADDVDFSTVFYFNMAFSIVLYIGLYFCAPLIAKIYKNIELISLIRVVGLIIIIAGAKNILQAYVSRNLLFKKFFFATLGGTIGAAIVGLWMAYNGFGVWALIAQYLFNATIDTIILWQTVKWVPQKKFSIRRLKVLFAYGWKLLVSTLLDRIWNQMRQLIIGVKYSTEDLAFYNKGHEFPEYATTAINSSIDSVLLPVMSRAQDDKGNIKNMARYSIRMSSYIMWPVMMGLAACSESLICVLIGEKWVCAVPYLRVFCITYAFYPIHTANLNAIKAMGRSDIFLVLEIIKKVVSLILIVSSMWFGVYIMALSTIVGNVISQIVNSWPNRKMLNYKYSEQLKDIMPSMLLSVFMALIVYLVQLLNLSYLITLMIQVIIGIVVYLLGSVIFRFESLSLLIKIVSGFVKKRGVR